MSFQEAFVKFMLENFNLDVARLSDESEEKYKERIHDSWENLTPAQKAKLRAYLLS